MTTRRLTTFILRPSALILLFAVFCGALVLSFAAGWRARTRFSTQVSSLRSQVSGRSLPLATANLETHP